MKSIFFKLAFCFLIFAFCFDSTAQRRQLKWERVMLAGTPSTVAGWDENGDPAEISVSGVTDGDKGDITVSASGATWTVDNLTSGTYTPTLVNGTNVSISTFRIAHYLRIKNEVHVSGSITMTPSASTGEIFIRFTLPIASNFTTEYDLSGVGAKSSSTGSTFAAVLTSDSSVDAAELSILSADGDANERVYLYTYTYTIK